MSEEKPIIDHECLLKLQAELTNNTRKANDE
jgi:hypothetical protein